MGLNSRNMDKGSFIVSLFPHSFLAPAEKNQKKQAQGALYVLLPQAAQRLPYAEFFGYFLVQRQESNII